MAFEHQSKQNTGYLWGRGQTECITWEFLGNFKKRSRPQFWTYGNLTNSRVLGSEDIPEKFRATLRRSSTSKWLLLNDAMADLSQADWRTLKQLRAASKLSFNIFPSLHMCIHSLILTTILLKQQDFNLVFIWYVQGFFYTSCEKFYIWIIIQNEVLR